MNLRWLWIPLVLLGLLGAACAAPDNGLVAYPDAGDHWVPLEAVAKYYGMKPPIERGARLLLADQTHVLRFDPNSGKLYFNGTLVWLHTPLRKVRNHWSLSQTDLRLVLDPLINPSPYLTRQKWNTIVLDPGHGGKDSGAIGRRGMEEKWITLDVARRARAILANAGYKVYLTRQTDRFIELNDRTRKAALWGADVFVSIHLNAVANRGADGPETWILAAPGYVSTSSRSWTRASSVSSPGNNFDKSNMILGYRLHKAVLELNNGEDRGVRHSRFDVLKDAPCPAALVEMDFISNAASEKNMTDSMVRERMARALAKGITDYIRDVKQARLLTD